MTGLIGLGLLGGVGYMVYIRRCPINKVTLRRARLVSGWYYGDGSIEMWSRDFRQVSYFGREPATQVDSTFYSPRDGKMSCQLRSSKWRWWM